jgi:hypothetical protein
VKAALRDTGPAAAFAGGLGLLCYGLSLIYLPLGIIAGGLVLAGGAILYERQKAKQRRPQS